MPTTTSIPVANQTDQTQFLYIGTTIAAGSGSTFQLVNNVHDAPITYAPVKGQYFYALLAGTSYTLHVEALSLGTAANIAADGISGFASASPLSVVSSSAMTGGDVWSSAADDGLVQTNLNSDGTYSTSPGFLTYSFAEYTTLFTDQGFSPAGADVNVPVAYAWTSNDVQSWEAYVSNARTPGIMNVAPVFSDSGYSADLDIPFATSPWYATLRQAALYSGGLSFDVPPNYAFIRAPNFLANVVQQIRWATANGLRSSVIISPGAVNDPANNQDADLLANTQKLVAYLEANNALPSQFIVENYDLDGTGNQLDTPTDNSLVSVANYLSGLHLTPSNSESGLEVGGTNKAADMIITGQPPSEQVSSAVKPFAGVSLFGTTGGQSISVTISLSATGLRTLSSGAGVADGKREIALTGTAAQITATLRSLTFQPDAGISGAVTIDVAATDANGSIATSTVLDVATPTPVPPVVELGLQTLLINVSEDKWTEDVQFTVSVDGVQAGGVHTATALRILGQSRDVAVTGSFGSGAHVVSVDFLNDMYGGVLKDNNLYVNAITLDGVTTTENTEQLWAGKVWYNLAPVAQQVTMTGSASFGTSSSAPTLRGTGVAGDAVTVTAVQGGSDTVLGTAAVTADGSWSLAPAALADGTYQITAIQTDGLGTASAAWAAQTLVVDTHVPTAPTVGLAIDTLTLDVSADWWQQPAQFTVSVDGRQVGTTNWVTALKDAGQSQTVTLTGSFGSGPHVVTADFLDDIWAGTAATDTNLYVNAITLNGVATTENNEQLWAGGIDYAVPAASANGAASITGTVVTDQSHPVGQGLAAPNAQVIVSYTADGYTQVAGSTTADANGHWSFSLDQAIPDGKYQISAAQVNAAGEQSAPSATETVIVDAGSPSAAAAVATGTAPIPSVSGTGIMTFVTNDMIIGVANNAVVTDAGSNNLFVLGTSGAASISGNVLGNGDVFDLRSALSAAHWDGSMSDIGSYPGSSVVNSGQDLQISVHASTGASILQLTLPGQEATTLATFMQHSLLH